jgi:hypothetical protein
MNQTILFQGEMHSEGLSEFMRYVLEVAALVKTWPTWQQRPISTAIGIDHAHAGETSSGIDSLTGFAMHESRLDRAH